MAVGYDPHIDIVEGIRSVLRRGEVPDESAITAALAGGPVKEIDLVIRTSGEQRISGFFPWQTQQAEVYVSPLMWPAFGERDLDEALASYASRR
jgi:short-chain Z-isoprenyl diphosphate synthase